MQKFRVFSMTRQKIMVIKQAGATHSPHHPCEQVAACNSLGDLIQLGYFFYSPCGFSAAVQQCLREKGHTISRTLHFESVLK